MNINMSFEPVEEEAYVNQDQEYTIHTIFRCICRVRT